MRWKGFGNTVVQLFHGPEGETEAKGMTSSHSEGLLRASGPSFLEEGMATLSCIVAWRIRMGRGAWWAVVHGVTELDT